MTEKKQGRRSAKAAEETKYQILSVAAGMFCDLGYERVSLRNISEKAGVSHSLIRHHFGSKEKIWHSISDNLHVYFQKYIAHIVNELPKGVTPNVSLYLFVMRLFSNMIYTKRPMQLIADAVRQEDALFDYFIDQVGDTEAIIAELADRYNNEYPDKAINIYEIKWQVIMYANAAVCMTPFLKDTWSSETDDLDVCVMKHWEMFNNQMTHVFSISDEWVLHPETLEELVYNVECEWKCNKEADC
ncbi:TetR/AcrR family transcriptional regulator [Vibrio profundi]|uniref:TetR/AcrR family transcriptional regulator n=1 Tax=Vibrio profundi TaxID=1774960 RepID=UPI0037359876